MISQSLWITGSSRSGKTTRLIEQFCFWAKNLNVSQQPFYANNQSHQNSAILAQSSGITHIKKVGFLILAANDDNRRELVDKIVTSTQGKYPIRGKTPLGFFQDEVTLFFPLLIELLGLKAQFPVRLRPETEQELATKLWQQHLDEDILRQAGMNEYRLVRRILDLLQLAAVSGTPTDKITAILSSGLGGEDGTNLEPEFFGMLLLEWRNWCLARGFLTYGIICELYSQHLLPNPIYKERLLERFQVVIADDVGDYPAIARQLFEVFLDHGLLGAFSYNQENVVRLGLGADPNYLAGIAARCRVENLSYKGNSGLGDELVSPIVELVTDPLTLLTLPDSIKSIQTTSRSELLRQTAQTIGNAIASGKVEAKDIVIIAPGLDAIARYTLVEILDKQGIHVTSLNEQRPLIASPLIRALLTMLSLVYPGLGRLVERDAVAEMLVVLSRGYWENPETASQKLTIDPVRAGLIADYCFVPHPESPNLLPPTSFDRWDRLGYAATTSYNEILQWLEKERQQIEQKFIPSPVSLLYAAVERFFLNSPNLPYEKLAVLRELLETAQHYWEIDTRLKNQDQRNKETMGSITTIGEFIQLLRRGTITANPYPVRPVGSIVNSVTLTTIFQYRSSRKSHPWHFWLDVGSPLWAKGGAATLFGAPYFLRDRIGEPWTAEDETALEYQRVQRILTDLLARVSQRLYLCHSDLAVNGQEQLGPLLPLVNACVSVVN
ncbi:hypothetical protein [Calothrix sp. PCC 6303]|uniref:hypothetical protein n=1 Tax=Calothrix sp. PCC 6303 TaxID=1170562 RepID=UPI0002A0350D|nr:hypothetical protein [Calothrix sp. PCC 6303]AFZ02105.1 hypothetical protein Cal6303_3163 [Calothrix sp. PCC 6303]